jgi:tetratricopeptide (TPR) repeat protein
VITTSRALLPLTLLAALPALLSPKPVHAQNSAAGQQALGADVKLHSGKSKQEQQADAVAQLKSDISKTERAIALTELQIARSRSAPYAPELQFRLAELFVEKSRYIYLLQQWEAGGPAAQGASQVAPEVRLTKQKALQTYDRILRDTPDWPGCDRARFYMAHEYRELGDFDKMLQYEEELVKLHPQSPLAGEALLIIGDHWFGAKDLGKAEEAYQRVLSGPPTPVRDLAAFKMGWVRFNQSKHADAVKYFEMAAASPLLDNAAKEVLSVKREALFDLVFSFTESRPSKGAPDYFEKLAQSHAVYLGVLEKLANRYFIKQEPEAAVPAYRKLITLSRDGLRDAEFAGRLHDAIKAGAEKTPPRPEDVAALVRIAARVRGDERIEQKERKQQLEDLEIWSRDLSTTLLLLARKGDKPDKAALSAAADAHASWLSLFRDNPNKASMQKNLADALFGAERWHEAGRAFEQVAKDADRPPAALAAKDDAEKKADDAGEKKDAKKPETASAPTGETAVEDALYNALAAHARAGREADTLSPWQRVDTLRAMGLLGAQYVSRFPKSARVAQVKFNVARASYDEADWKRASELFAAYVADHPETSDAEVAANLSLDALHNLGDYDALEKAGKELAANPKISPRLRAELLDTVQKARGEQISVVALQSTARTGDAGRGLVELAEKQPKSPLAEKALHAAFTTYREKRDGVRLAEVAQKFLADYPASPLAVDVLTTQARFAVDAADFDAAAAAYESLGEKFPGETTGVEALQTAAALRQLLGDPRKAVLDLERLPAERRAGVQGLRLAEARLLAGDPAGAETQAQLLLKADPGDGDAGVLLGRALLVQGKNAEAQKAMAAALKSVRKSRVPNEVIAHLWDLGGEAALRLLTAMPAEALEPQIALLKSMKEASSAVAQLRASDLAVLSVYRLAAGFEHVAQSLAATPPPPKLSAADQQTFLSTVQQQAAQLRAQAAEAYDGCAKKARELDLFAPWVAACEKGQPAAGASGPQAAQAMSAAPAAANAAISKTREKLFARPSAGTLDELGVLQLAQGDLRRARLSFQRAVELDSARAAGHAGLGVALARLGELASAREAYRSALELDPTLDRAHAGLAALRCRAGDDAGAKDELSRVRQKPDPSTPDVDPELFKCAGGK